MAKDYRPAIVHFGIKNQENRIAGMPPNNLCWQYVPFLKCNVMRNFRELIIWKQGIQLTANVYELCKQLPKDETYGLKSQITRAAVSIPANIAEGCSRRSEKDFRRFLEISIGSAFELETHLVIAEKLGYIDRKSVDEFLRELTVEQKQINALIIELTVD